MKPGPRNLITDVAGLRVGNASDPDLKSGTTVLTADAPFVASVSVQGGAPGTRETDLLAPDKSAPGVDALVLSGGSAFGLGAAEGVMAALRAAGRGFAVFSARVPIVPAAILFDLLNGGAKDWDESPYPALGRAAFDVAGTEFQIGTAGAGTGAQTARFKGGLGSASVVLDSGATVGALVAVNPMGCAVTPSGKHFWAAPFEMDGEFGGLGPDPVPGFRPLPPSRKVEAMARQGNTTIGIVATDAALDKAQAQRLAVAAHDGLARALVPSHSPHDGDLVFAAATGARRLEDPASELLQLGHAGAVAMSRAIARALWEATPSDGDTLPTFRQSLGQ
ncbi:peptidase T4 [Roseivivax halodurans JCM 10272]|uniref:Peptidase T4 n=1 Tax=Roseivivax halodurans JCM 10272 TaxID=1449350 RepID=X7EI88_9RHOB|nr:P1 family peptidase [Roseivivax halodurans]ETX14871.1 peptidase T4 [Roseivivax halodurans JCM 10272]